jgi:hypothetical protein
MSLRLLVAVELVLTVVSLRLNEVLYAELVTAEAHRVAVRDLHSDDELKISDRRVLRLQILLLQLERRLSRVLLVIDLSDRVLR